MTVAEITTGEKKGWCRIGCCRIAPYNVTHINAFYYSWKSFAICIWFDYSWKQRVTRGCSLLRMTVTDFTTDNNSRRRADVAQVRRLISQIWMRFTTDERALLKTTATHSTRNNDSCDTCMLYQCASHVTHMNESYHIYEWVSVWMSHTP